MPGDTTLDGNANDSAERSTIRVASTNYRCNSCQTSFLSGQDQRAHMKEAWHVHNVKRRIASLSPVPRGEFDAGMGARPVKKSTKTGKNHATSGTIGDSRSQSEEETEADDHADGETDDTDAGDNDENVSPYQCLFCNHNFTQDDTGFSNNLEHIQTAHGLFIPDRQLVADLQSFISYLATEIRTWHECLYCGATKPSTEGIQSHMRDKGHCFLNFDREPELLDFWERPPSMDGQPAKSDRPIDPFETEFQLATGKVIGSRHAAPASRKPPKSPEFALVSLPWNQEDSEPLPLPLPGVQSASSRQLARGEEMGLVGISHQQRQALVLAEKKAQRSEMMARKAREWVYARGSNSQKFDQIDGSGKWGKQNHKLQPR